MDLITAIFVTGILFIIDAYFWIKENKLCGAAGFAILIIVAVAMFTNIDPAPMTW